MTDNTRINNLLRNAWVLRREKKYEEARELIAVAQRICKPDDYFSLGRIYHVLMQFKSDHNHLFEALELCRQSMSYYKKTGDPIRIAHSLRHVADLERRIEHDNDALQHYEEAISIYRQNERTSKGDLANALRGYGILLEKIGKIEEAIAIWKETKKLYKS